MSEAESKRSEPERNALARRLRQMPPRRVKNLLDGLGLDYPAKDLAFDRTRYDVVTLAPLAFEAECHVLRVEVVVERTAKPQRR